jgi:protein-S-isoprenylcysteine O-methyltransferase Ste14
MALEHTDSPGVIAPPPLLYLGAILLGAGLDRLWRLRLPVEGWGRVVGLLLTASAVVLAAWAVRAFGQAKTSPKPHKPSTAIVTSGPFRFTRNPIYIAFTLAQLGVAIMAASGWILALLVPVHALVRIGVVAREERYLERKFGEEYLRYKRGVRRWL